MRSMVVFFRNGAIDEVVPAFYPELHEDTVQVYFYSSLSQPQFTSNLLVR